MATERASRDRTSATTADRLPRASGTYQESRVGPRLCVRARDLIGPDARILARVVAAIGAASRIDVSGPSIVTSITPNQSGRSHTLGPRQWTIEMAHRAVFPRVDLWSLSVLEHRAIQASAGTVVAPGQDPTDTEAIAPTAELGSDDGLMRNSSE